MGQAYNWFFFSGVNDTILKHRLTMYFFVWGRETIGFSYYLKEFNFHLGDNSFALQVLAHNAKPIDKMFLLLYYYQMNIWILFCFLMWFFSFGCFILFSKFFLKLYLIVKKKIKIFGIDCSITWMFFKTLNLNLPLNYLKWTMIKQNMPSKE